MTTMTSERNPVFEAKGAVVEMRYEDHDDVSVLLRSDPAGAGARSGARLVGDAVSHARANHARRVLTTLDASRPSSGFVLDELRKRVGRDVGTLALRRAGASILVTVDLAPTTD
jgi:hypothetical protein